MSIQLRAAADDVVSRIKQDNPTFEFDPATIIVIIEIIKVIFPIIVEYCNKNPADASDIARLALAGGVLGENRYFRMARRAARREVGMRDYVLSGGDAMLKVLLEEAADKNAVELEALYAEI